MHRLLVLLALIACTEPGIEVAEQSVVLSPEVVCQLPVGATTPFPRLIVEYDDIPDLQLDASSPGVTLGADGVYRFADANVTVAIWPIARGVWRMTLQNTHAIAKVDWPFEHPGPGLGNDPSDDRVYFPLVGGVVEREGIRVPYGWHGYRYPGESFAPIMITADADRATILASWDREHRSVYPMHGNAQSLLMHCPISAVDGCATITPGTTSTYTVLYGTVNGQEPWFTAASHYACWLRMTTPSPTFTPEMWAEDAMLGVGAQDLSDEPTAPGQADVSWVYDVQFAPYHAALGIGRVLFWGLMSPYAGSCCQDAIRIDERYDLELDDTVTRIRQTGKHVGFYTGVNDALGMGTSAGAWLRDWWSFNATRNTDTSFVDQIGRGAWGAEVSTHLPRFSDGTIQPDAIIEGYVDVFPRAALLSGSLRMEMRTCKLPATIGTCDPACDRQCAFLPLARTIMGNHIGYLGASNGDHVYMGAAADYDLERQAFLLGLKLDLWNPGVSAAVVERIRARRALVGWWAYQPVYLHQTRLSDVPVGVDARLHRGSDGRCFVTVDNVARVRNATLRVNGYVYAIEAPPADQTPALSIIRVTASRCGS